MRKIYTFGETVYDIIFRNGKPETAIPGGAMLNSAVSLGRLKLPVSYITEIGKDEIGDLIFDFLNNNGVDTACVDRFDDGRTALALAFLDENENASYSFYKLYPKERLTAGFPVPRKEDILLFGSFFALSDEVRTPLRTFVHQAFNAQSLIIYDPNYRKPHGSEFPGLMSYLKENISFASIVRGSDEDFRFIADAGNADEAFEFVRKNGCSYLIYTVGGDRVEFRSEKHSFSVAVPVVKVVSTIGAGDNFNAGLIYGLYSHNLGKSDLGKITKDDWVSLIKTGISFGSNVCTGFENYISDEFAVSCSPNS